MKYAKLLLDVFRIAQKIGNSELMKVCADGFNKHAKHAGLTKRIKP